MNKSTPDNFQSEQKPNSELQPIVSTSSHAIGNTNVGRSAGSEHWLYPFKNKIISVERGEHFCQRTGHLCRPGIEIVQPEL